MSPLSDLPSDILPTLFSACNSITDLLSLSSTCRSLRHSALDLTTGISVVDHILDRCAPCYSDAKLISRLQSEFEHKTDGCFDISTLDTVSTPAVLSYTRTMCKIIALARKAVYCLSNDAYSLKAIFECGLEDSHRPETLRRSATRNWPELLRWPISSRAYYCVTHIFYFFLACRAAHFLPRVRDSCINLLKRMSEMDLLVIYMTFMDFRDGLDCEDLILLGIIDNSKFKPGHDFMYYARYFARETWSPEWETVNDILDEVEGDAEASPDSELKEEKRREGCSCYHYWAYQGLESLRMHDWARMFEQCYRALGHP